MTTISIPYEISRLHTITNSDDTRRNLQYIHIIKRENKYLAEATNGHIAMRVYFVPPEGHTLPPEFFVHRDVAKQLCKLKGMERIGAILDLKEFSNKVGNYPEIDQVWATPTFINPGAYTHLDVDYLHTLTSCACDIAKNNTGGKLKTFAAQVLTTGALDKDGKYYNPFIVRWPNLGELPYEGLIMPVEV